MDPGEQIEQYIMDVLEPMLNGECTSVKFDEFNVTLKDLNRILFNLNSDNGFASELDTENKTGTLDKFVIFTKCKNYIVEVSIWDGVKSFSKL